MIGPVMPRFVADQIHAAADDDRGAKQRVAVRQHAPQREVDRRIAAASVPLFPASGNVLTHCNTGPIATGGEGTALGCFVAVRPITA